MASIPTVTAGYVGAYNVYDDGYTVGSTARCSCGVGHYGYTTSYFVDMCPNCGGNLYFEQGAYSGPAYTSPEGLWACSRCDMDFCAQCGKEHIIGSQYWLYPSDPPKPPEPVEKQEPKPEPTHLEKLQKIYLDDHRNVSGNFKLIRFLTYENPLGGRENVSELHGFLSHLITALEE